MREFNHKKKNHMKLVSSGQRVHIEMLLTTLNDENEANEKAVHARGNNYFS
jgi:hypothetical protein